MPETVILEDYSTNNNLTNKKKDTHLESFFNGMQKNITRMMTLLKKSTAYIKPTTPLQ